MSSKNQVIHLPADWSKTWWSDRKVLLTTTNGINDWWGDYNDNSGGWKTGHYDSIKYDDNAWKTCIVINSNIETKTQEKKGEENMSQAKRRLVQMVVYDPNLNVADEDSVLYDSGLMVSSKTEEELKLELDFKTLLREYNEKRVKVLDNARTETVGKEIYLKPAKISDLVIEFVTI